MEIRRYRETDIPEMLKHISTCLSKIQFHDIYFCREKMEKLLLGNVQNSFFFCNLAISDGEIIGGMCAQVVPFIFSYDAIAQDHFLYVIPSQRRLRVTTGLVAAYIEWAKKRKVKRIQLSNSMGIEIERFAKLATRLGFEQMGTTHQMRF